MTAPNRVETTLATLEIMLWVFRQMRNNREPTMPSCCEAILSYETFLRFQPSLIILETLLVCL